MRKLPSITIIIELLNGEKITMYFTILPDGWGDFDDGIILCSPKEMGMQKSIDDLVSVLEEGVRLDSEYGYGKIFKEDVSEYVSEDFITSTKEFLEKVKNIPSMDDIKEISVTLSYNVDDMGDSDEYIEQTTTYVYDRVTKAYTYNISGDFYDNDTYFLDYKDAVKV